MNADRLSSPLAWRFKPGARAELLVLCDHASNAIPDDLADLGLSIEDRQRHIAWDPGAAGVAEALAERLDCPAFFGAWSRLVVDLNRAAGADDLIARHSDGTMVPGNAELTDAQRAQRIERFHRPYHRAIEQHLREAEAVGPRTVLISVHTFTPALAGRPARPWHAGVVWKHRPHWLAPLLAQLGNDGMIIGDNRPYDGLTEMGYTLEHLGVEAGRAHVMFEVRQDLLCSSADQEAWAQRLFDGLQACGVLTAAVGPWSPLIRPCK